MVVVILAGGSSTRLFPYTDEIIPKILLPVEKNAEGGLSPLAARLFRQARACGSPRIVIVGNYRNAVKIREATGAYVLCQEGAEQLSAVVSGMRYDLDDDYLVVDGDNFFFEEDTISKFAEKAVRCSDTITVGTFKPSRYDKYAMIIEKDGRVSTIVEKPSVWASPLIAKSGLLYIPRVYAKAVVRMARAGAQTTTEVIAEWGDARCLPLEGAFMDIGTWDDYIAILRRAIDA